MTLPPTTAFAPAPPITPNLETPELEITLTKTQTKVKKVTQSSGSCGCTSKNENATGMSESMKARIDKHPCYSEEAHHHYARMHVAVAPACNIQCNFCNRKYDCANESRPGVVSELLTPEEAAHKVLVVASKISQH